MPLGWERLNVRSQPPNDRIVFIKPLKGPDETTAHGFLSRIAAICAPVMRANYLSVVSLEEFEPNREFWGRNFNAGEAIQLVLKSPNGRWLPFRFVQMVMMHELAHCKQMNHSRAFWAVRNAYAGELRALWDKDYTGDGLWGRGQALYDGQYAEDSMPATEDTPAHLCGGVYRTGRGKRRRNGAEKPLQTYAERKQCRMEKKFGTAGEALGGNELIRTALEKGKGSTGGKPRVAQSKRGRELRAAAALARFEKGKQPEPTAKGQEVDSETEDEYEDDDEENFIIKEEALDTNGSKMLDFKGHGMVKVCGDEGNDDSDARCELEELGQFGKSSLGAASAKTAKATEDNKPKSGHAKHEHTPAIKEEDISSASETETEDEILPPPNSQRQPSKENLNSVKDLNTAKPIRIRIHPASALKDATQAQDQRDNQGQNHQLDHEPPSHGPSTTTKPILLTSKALTPPGPASTTTTTKPILTTSTTSTTSTVPTKPITTTLPTGPTTASTTTTFTTFITSTTPPTTTTTPTITTPTPCPLCSLTNPPTALTCLACAHVLRLDTLPNHWRCSSAACQGSEYVYAGDRGRCGVCGALK